MRQICRSYKQWFTHFLQCRMWVFWLPMGSSVWTERSDLHLSLSRRLQFHSWHRMEYGEQLPLTPDLNSLLHVFEFLFFLCVCLLDIPQLYMCPELGNESWELLCCAWTVFTRKQLYYNVLHLSGTTVSRLLCVRYGHCSLLHHIIEVLFKFFTTYLAVINHNYSTVVYKHIRNLYEIFNMRICSCRIVDPELKSLSVGMLLLVLRVLGKFTVGVAIVYCFLLLLLFFFRSAPKM